MKSDFFTVDKENELVYINYAKWKDLKFMMAKSIVYLVCSYFDFIVVIVVIGFGIIFPSMLYSVMILVAIGYLVLKSPGTVNSHKKKRWILVAKSFQMIIWGICLASRVFFITVFEDEVHIPDRIERILDSGISDKFFIFILLQLLVIPFKLV